jgi:hypothetical protein
MNGRRAVSPSEFASSTAISGGECKPRHDPLHDHGPAAAVTDRRPAGLDLLPAERQLPTAARADRGVLDIVSHHSPEIHARHALVQQDGASPPPETQATSGST